MVGLVIVKACERSCVMPVEAKACWPGKGRVAEGSKVEGDGRRCQNAETARREPSRMSCLQTCQLGFYDARNGGRKGNPCDVHELYPLGAKQLSTAICPLGTGQRHARRPHATGPRPAGRGQRKTAARSPASLPAGLRGGVLAPMRSDKDQPLAGRQHT